MSKELECLDRIDKRNYLTEREHKEFLGVVEKALKEYEAIKNAEPTKAMECLESMYARLPQWDLSRNIDQCNTIKQALQRLEAIKNANPSEALESLGKLKGMEISSMPFSDEYGTQEVDLNDIRKVGSQLNTDFREYTTTIKQALLKAQEQEKENELLKEIIKGLFDRGCPLHQYTDKDFGLTIEVDNECSIMHLGKFKDVDLDKKLQEVLEDE